LSKAEIGLVTKLKNSAVILAIFILTYRHKLCIFSLFKLICNLNAQSVLVFSQITIIKIKLQKEKINL